jgi:hypothetical protein
VGQNGFRAGQKSIERDLFCTFVEKGDFAALFRLQSPAVTGRKPIRSVTIVIAAKPFLHDALSSTSVFLHKIAAGTTSQVQRYVTIATCGKDV